MTPSISVATTDVFAAFAAGSPSGGQARPASDHLASELERGLSSRQLLDRAAVLASANDLLAATAAVLPGIVPFRRALTRLLGRPVGQTGSGPTCWVLYGQLEAAQQAASVVRAAVHDGQLPALGDAAPFVAATTIDTAPATPSPSRIATSDARSEVSPMTRDVISTTGAPAAIGPYSQAIVANGLVFCAGQIGLDPATGELVEGVDAQAERALRNLAAVLDGAGCGMADVAKTTVFLVDMNDFGGVNEVYARHMPDPPPARSTFAVAALPRNARIEIEAIAVLRR